MQFSKRTKALGRVSYIIGLCVLAVISIGVAITLYLLGTTYDTILTPAPEQALEQAPFTSPEPFPIGVNPATATITDNPLVEEFLQSEVPLLSKREAPTRFWEKVQRFVLQSGAFQQLASVNSRVLVIWPGERQEEIVDTVGDILNWDTLERAAFVTLMEKANPLKEGVYFPGNYLVAKDADSVEVATVITARFNEEVLNRYTAAIADQVPLTDALILASLLEREAYTFDDMQQISGVIWNRLFIDMPLQIDATLQYVRGSSASEPWWPIPVPRDKYLSSPYNTYQNKGLPPAPIANPSLEAIVAALNPNLTDCLFYFHDDDGDMHCSADYGGHVRKLQNLYGQGR